MGMQYGQYNSLVHSSIHIYTTHKTTLHYIQVSVYIMQVTTLQHIQDSVYGDWGSYVSAVTRLWAVQPKNYVSTYGTTL